MAAADAAAGRVEGTPTVNSARLIADILGWPILQLSIARACLYVPERYLVSSGAPTGLQRREARFYREALRIRRWKRRLPDGVGLVGGAFPKRRLAFHDRGYLRRFAMETRRAEMAHWCMLFCFPLFYPWNPTWACAVMTLYAVAANLPCILVQRFNRTVILRRLERHPSGSGVEPFAGLSPRRCLRPD